MDRFSEQTAADLAHNYARHIFAEELYNSTPVPNDGDLRCDNCGLVVERVTPVPEFNYLGCDDCMEEALRAIALETSKIAEIMGETTITREEGEAFLTWIDRKPATMERLQGELFPEEVA